MCVCMYVSIKVASRSGSRFASSRSGKVRIVSVGMKFASLRSVPSLGRIKFGVPFLFVWTVELWCLVPSSEPSGLAHDHMSILDVVVRESVAILQLHTVAVEVQLVQVVARPIPPQGVVLDHDADVVLQGLH